ncbi:MAG: type II toxin-antitoxin system VapC family toxin [Acidobacteriota bacterium]|nr:type II toxin-antitoxin system VapC family toxin [Acidobacteriota bacterium]MDH3523591.1 type II toxin-antitoxin system VapC family toxin [Acidobacteriota bacterium]
MILETTFLVDLDREVSRGAGGPAQDFLERHAEERLYLTPTIAGELAAGPRVAEREAWETLIAPFRVLEINRDVCWEYGRAYRYLSDNGLAIGGNDLWIAAAGLAHRVPVVTRNERHYRRVPGLSVLTYEAPAARP